MTAAPRLPPAVPALRTHVVVALAGGVLMALEILALRVLSPSFGSSVYVWGAVLSVFLAAMSAGYVIGGRLADQRPRLEVLGSLLIAASLGVAVLVGTALRLAETIATWTDAPTWGPLVAASLLFGPATALLASASPFAVRLATAEVSGVGRIAGRLYAVSTVGSLAGTLLATFVLLPLFELDTILVLLAVGACAAGTLACGSSLVRRPATAAVAGLTLVALLVGWTGGRGGAPGDLIERRLSPYQTLEVVDHRGQRILLSNGHRQAAITLDDGEPSLRYARAAKIALLFHPEPRRALFVGLGTGSVARVLRRWQPQLEADHVEIDPAVLALAERHFGFERSPQDRVHLDDGRRFLRRAADRWDLIVVDTYVGLSIPFHLATREMFQLTERRLTPDGVLLLNLAAPPDQPLVAAVIDTVRSVFPAVSIFPVPGAGGTLVVARRDRLDPEGGGPASAVDLAARAAELDRHAADEPTFAEILASEVSASEVSPSGVPAGERAEPLILRDARAPVDRLLHLDRPGG